jgi:mono/diheme cytochrome c family protein
MKHRLAPLVLVTACGGNVPANPTYFTDVEPILRANCARCHGADPSDPKIATFRLDRYVKDDTATFDAYDYATGMDPAMMRVAVDHESPAMPPDYSLTDRQRDILGSWIDHGAPKGTRDNHLPQITLLSPTGVATADQSVDVSFLATDADLDGLVVQLWAHDLAGGDDIPLGKETGGGTRALTLDTGTLASTHDFEIYAVLDDGFFDDPAMNKTRATLIPTLHVDHGAKGTAPTVQLVSPNGGETLIGSATITWTASDPDAGDTVHVDLGLYDTSDMMVASIATGLPNTGSYMWTIPSSIAANTPYYIRVTATDMLGEPPNVRFDESDGTVTVAQATTTTYTWADVKPIFNTYCGSCHGDPARTVAIDYFCLLQYDKGEASPPCAATDEGAFEVSSLVFNRMVSAKSMPPASSPQPAQADIDKVGSWIQGGAPYGSGPTDQHPTLTWTAPGASTLSATNGTATLQWTDADDMGLTSDLIEFVRAGTATQCNQPAICSNVSGWQTLTMNTLTGTSQAQSFAWSTATGCYCVRGTVTDSASQTTTVQAAKPVKF